MPVYPPTTLIVPLDTSATSETVLPWAALLARDRGMSIRLVSVWSRKCPIPGLDPNGAQAEMVDALTTYLQSVASRPDLAELKPTCEVAVGGVVEQLKAIAEREPHAMLLLCSHGESGFRERVLGHVTDELLQIVRVPFLIIPAPALDMR